MKLCDITQFFSPTSGGVKRYLLSKAAYIQARTGISHVLVVPGSEDRKTVEGVLTTYTIASPKIPGTQSYRLLYRIGRIRRIIEAEKPDLVEVGDPYHLGWAVSRLTRKMGLPLVSFYHSDYPRALERTVERFLGKRPAKWSQRALSRYIVGLYNRMTATFVASAQTLETLRQCGVQRLHQTPIGLDTEVFHPRGDREEVRRELGIAPGRFLLLYLGRLSREKNIAMILELIDLLSGQSPEKYHLLLVGQGHLDEKVRRFSERRKDVTWLPYCGQSSRLAEIYSAADLFVHAGATETYGLTVLEAQACGTPVVALRGGGTDALNQAGADYLAPLRTPSSFARTIQSIQPRLDETLRHQVREGIVSQYRAEVCFERQFDIYRQLLQTFHANNAYKPEAMNTL